VASKPKFSDQIRQAVRKSGVSRYRIEKDTGIDGAALSRFTAGKCGLSLETLDVLAAYLNLEIVAKGVQRGERIQTSK
jgi:hypothetical protein